MVLVLDACESFLSSACYSSSASLYVPFGEAGFAVYLSLFLPNLNRCT